MRTNPILALTQLWTKRHIARAKKRKKEAHEASRAMHQEQKEQKERKESSCAAPGVNSNSPVKVNRSPPAAAAQGHAAGGARSLPP